MNQREIAELRRRLKPERSGITHVRGCCVNDKKEIIATFDQPMGETVPEETEAIFSLLRKTLSGAPGRNLLSIPFSTRQVLESEEHQTLCRLRKNLRDEEAVAALYEHIRATYEGEGNYLILLAQENYDVPSYNRNDDNEGSNEVYSYILCCVCPVKSMQKPSLGFLAYEQRFRSATGDPSVGAPELGFLFPAFDDRATNLYNALFYTRDIANNHSEITGALFGSEPTMPPAAEQRETFHAMLVEAIGEECRYEVVEGVQQQLSALIDEHKANREKETLVVSAETVKHVLESSGVGEEHAAAFEKQCNETFGEGAEFCPGNLIDKGKLAVVTPDVSIKVSPERSDLIETRTIDGVKYILIRAEGDVQVNGISIHID
jgi:hypothetical protein